MQNLSTTESLKFTLIQRAQAVLGEFALSTKWLSAGSVASALVSRQGNFYTGICLDLACGIGFCAEHAAIAEMLKARETEIEMIVAVSAEGVLAPCGRCRELMVQVNKENFGTRVVMPGERIATVKELLPDHWIV